MAITMSIKELEYERLRGVLENLKDLAKNVDEYQYDIIDDYRHIAESDMREIVDILLELEL